jgi:hypothetical protein
MSIAIVRKALLWCTVINYGVLLVWWLFFLIAHDWIHGWHSRWFHLSVELFDALHYAGMALYKMGILLFNLVPAIALTLLDEQTPPDPQIPVVEQHKQQGL